MEAKMWNRNKVILAVGGILVLLALGCYFFVYNPVNRKLNTQIALNDTINYLYSQEWAKNDSLKNQMAVTKQNQKTADSTNRSLSVTMNSLDPALASLGIPPIGWNISRLKYVSDNLNKEGVDLNGDWGSVYAAVNDYCGKAGFAILRQICIAKGPAIKGLFTKYSKELGAVKSKWHWPEKINESIIPFLFGTNKRFDKDFLAFYKIHSKSKTEGVLSHPGWKKFSENMLKKYPKDFTGDGDVAENNLYHTYLDWRSAYVIPAKARKTCGEIIKLYNTLE